MNISGIQAPATIVSRTSQPVDSDIIGKFIARKKQRKGSVGISKCETKKEMKREFYSFFFSCRRMRT